MADGFYISCECGYEVYILLANAGTAEECINCGADLDTTAPERSEESSGDEEDTTPSSELSSGMRAEQIESRKRAVTSPFEDEDDGSGSRASFEMPTPVPDVEEEPPDYVASLFEDDSDEDKVDADAPDPALLRTYSDPEHTASYQGSTETAKCPRCGNVFRGDWDKQEIGEETICFICSNQATDGIPDRILERASIAPNPVTEATGWSGSVNAAIPEGPQEEKFWLFVPESPQFRAMIYAMAIGLILVTVFAVLFTGGDSVPDPDDFVETRQPNRQSELPEDMRRPADGREARSTAEAVEAEPELPRWASIVYVVLRFGFVFFAQFLTFYVVLLLTDRLPHGDIVRDSIVIGYMMLLLSVVTAVYIGFAYTIGTTMMGPIFMMMVSVACFFVSISIVINVLDFRIRDFFYLFFISGFVHAFVLMISAFFYAGLATIAL